MSLNHQEIDLILSEWQIQGYILQNVIQTDYENFYFEWFKSPISVWMHICLASSLTRIQLGRPPQKPKGAQPRFSEFLRANLKGAYLNHFEHNDSNRIVIFDCSIDGTAYRLMARLWSNNANILLLDKEQNILDAAFRRPSKGEIQAAPYSAPIRREPNKLAGFSIRLWQSKQVIDFPHPFNRYIEESYQNLESSNALKQMREQCLSLWSQVLKKSSSRHDALQKQLTLSKSHERWKELGDLLLSNLACYQSGMSWIELEDWHTSTLVKVPLDPKIDAKTNAEHYYQRYRKARDSLAFVSEDLLRQEKTIEQLKQMESELRTSSDLAKLRDYKEQIEALVQRIKKTTAQVAQTRPGASFVLWGHTVYIGRNAQESDTLLRHFSRGNDFWLHVRDIPGGHVFIKTMRGKTPPLELLLDAAHLAVWYSKAKHFAEADLIYTQVKYLRRAKHGALGSVIPSQEKNLHLRVDSKRLKQLLES